MTRQGGCACKEVTMDPADPASDWLRDRFKLQYSYLVPAKLSPFSYSIHHSTTKLHSPWPVFTGSIIYPAECLVAAVCVLGLNSCHHPLLLSLSLKLNPAPPPRIASHWSLSLGPWQAFTEVQENTCARLRELLMHWGASHAT